jgi:hypothetical protein
MTKTRTWSCSTNMANRFCPKRKRKREQEEAEAKRSGTTVEQLEQRRKARERGRDDYVAADYAPPKWQVYVQHVRRFLQLLLTHVAFHACMVVVVLVSSGAMAFKNPIAAPDTGAAYAVGIIDTVAKSYYIAEAVLNIFAFGFIKAKDSYLRRDKWNAFDLFITVLGLVLLIVKNTAAGGTVAYRACNALMALRPLSLVRYSTSMNLVARALGQATVEMRFAVIAIVVVIFIFAVVGVQLFSGRMRACTLEGEILHVSESYCVSNVTGSVWTNTTPNFDNIGESFFTLFIVLTLELWTLIMFRAMDYDAPGLPPKVNSNAWASLYFVAFAIVGGLIMTNIFMSVLCDCYNRSKRAVTAARSLKLTREVNGWIGTNKRLLRALPKEAHESLLVNSPTAALGSFMGSMRKKMNPLPSNAMLSNIGDGMTSGFKAARAQVIRIIDSPRFINGCYLVIFANFLTLAINHYPAPDGWSDGMNNTEIVFTALFAFEAVMKIFGEGMTTYFASNWNRFDFFVVVISILSVSLRDILNSRLDALFRSLRVLRLARIIRGKSSLSELVRKFGMAVASLGGVAAIIFVFFYMFAVMGMELFGRVHWSPTDGTSGVSHMSNFSNIGMSLFMLIRLTFGGDWWLVWWATRENSPQCDFDLGDCGPPAPIPQLYFVVFIGFSTFVLKNLLVAVLVDQFSSSSDLRALHKQHAQIFIDAWRRFDPQLTMKVSGFDVLPIVRSIPRKAPIGFNRLPQKKRVALELRMLMYMKIRDPKERNISFESAVDMLCHMAYETPPPEDRPFQMELLDDEVDEEAARLSAVLIVINQVARRLLEKRRKRRSEAVEDIQRAEQSSMAGNPSFWPSAAGVVDHRSALLNDDVQEELLDDTHRVPVHQQERAVKKYVPPRTFAEQLLVDPDVIEFDSDEDEFPVLPSPPRNAATSSAALVETVQKAQANRSRFQEHNMVGSLPAFDDSDDDDALSAGHSGDDEDAGKDAAASDTDSEDSVRPFFQAVSREAKSQAKAAHSTLVNSFTNTRIGRAASLVAAKASQKVRDAVESVTSGSSGSRQNTDNSTFTVSTPAARAAPAPLKHRRIASEVEMAEMPPPTSGKPVPPPPQQQQQSTLAPALTPPQQPPPQLPRAASYRVAPPAGEQSSSPLQASAFSSPSSSPSGQQRRAANDPPRFLSTAPPRRPSASATAGMRRAASRGRTRRLPRTTRTTPWTKCSCCVDTSDR